LYQIVVNVSLSAGKVDALGLPSAFIGTTSFINVLKKLHDLGVLERQSSWCGMVETSESGPKELVQYLVDPNETNELKGIICPVAMYDASRHACDIEKSGAPPSSSSGECPLCTYIKGGGCKDAFLPFQECITAAAENVESAHGKPNCMNLFDPVVKCMQETPQKRAYYAAFMEDFSHLFTK
jgi:hypothetical protein